MSDLGRDLRLSATSALAGALSCTPPVDPYDPEDCLSVAEFCVAFLERFYRQSGAPMTLSPERQALVMQLMQERYG
jgi:hypothetical protein